MWKTRIQKCIPLGTFSNKLLSTHLWMGFLPWEQELHCLILEKNGTIINCTLFWNDLEYQHKNSTCQDLDELQGFSLYYMYSMSHTWGLKQNNILYPVSPNGGQHQFSPYNIHMLPREMVMRVNQMITEGKCSDLLSNSLNYCNSLRKCMKISMENLYVDIGT